MATRSENALLSPGASSISSSSRNGLAFGALMALSLVVSGCGFEPIYAVRDGGAYSLEVRSIDLPYTRAGRYLGDRLDAQLQPGEDGKYLVVINLSETRRDALTSTDGSTERIELTVAANVTISLVSSEIVNTVNLRVSSSYNRSFSELTNQETEASLRNTALDRIAADIQLALADLPDDASPELRPDSPPKAP